MAFHRLYTGSDGHSHIEEMDLSSHPTLTTLHETKGIVFRSGLLSQVGLVIGIMLPEDNM